MMTTFRVATLTFAFALATYWFDWRAIAVVAIVYGLIAHRTKYPGITAASAAALAWALLLAFAALRGAHIGILVHQLAGVMQLSPAALLIATLGFPALLAGCATVLATVAATVKQV